ncbi:MAG: aldehyde:ferredoxin oxidoreductase, partial [Nitrospirae bacterium]
MKGGYTGRYLTIDLSERSWAIEETPGWLIKDYLGGRGFGVALLREQITKDPFSPDMPLVIATGPLVGTPSPTSGRFSVVSRSPLTGTIFDCSVGGRFGTRLKKAGFDMVVITGASNEWVMLEITNEGVSFKPAGNMAGLPTGDIFKGLEKDISSAIIGPAGERLVRFASIVFDGHYLAGRGGLGAVMGAKHLKMITVRGGGNVGVYSDEKLKKARENVMRLLRATPAIFGEFGLSEFGTAALVDLIHARRMEPTMNFRRSFFPGAGKYSGYRMKVSYDTKKTGCSNCPILCKKKGRKGEVIPEFETASHFGA